jgi:hypothetical protein
VEWRDIKQYGDVLMIPQDQHVKERQQHAAVLTLMLLGLLAYTGLENAPLTIALVAGYVVSLGFVDYLLRTSLDE